MAMATLTHGKPLSVIDYTPGSAVTAGDVIVSQSRCFIAHLDIAANKLGALAAGGAVYKVTKTTGAAWSIGQTIYWDATNSKGTHTDNSGANKPLGKAEKAQVSGDTTGYVLHSTDI